MDAANRGTRYSGSATLGKEFQDKYHVNANTDCVTCHR